MEEEDEARRERALESGNKMRRGKLQGHLGGCGFVARGRLFN